MLLHPAAGSGGTIATPHPDAAPDLGINSWRPEVGSVLPDSGRPDARLLLPDGSVVPDGRTIIPDAAKPDVSSPPDLVMRPDGGPDSGLVPPPPVDARPDVFLSTPEVGIIDARRPRPDALPPFQICVDGAACSTDCTATCQTVGTSNCACSNGVLTCGACQPPHITFTFTPCPDNASGTTCDTDGLTCPVYTNGGISGACACLGLGGGGTRWFCL
jgi:hypothetical protein